MTRTVTRVDPAASSDAAGTGCVPAAPLSPDAMEAHVAAACDAARDGTSFEFLDLRGHPNAGAAIDAIVAALGTPSSNFKRLGLKSLNLEFAMQVTDAHIVKLAQCGTLVDVNVNATSAVGDLALNALANENANTLQSLQLYWNVRVTDTALVGLIEKCGARLKLLNLSGCKRLTDLTAEAIGSHCAQIEHLDCTRLEFTNHGLSKICVSPTGLQKTLHTLNLYATPLLGKRGFRQIAALENLTWLDLCGAQQLTDDALGEIADACVLLRYLNLSWCLAVTDVGVTKVCKQCPGLELLSVHGNRHVSDAVITALHEHNNPGSLHTLDIRGCGVDHNRGVLVKKFPNLTEFVHHT